MHPSQDYLKFGEKILEDKQNNILVRQDTSAKLSYTPMQENLKNNLFPDDLNSKSEPNNSIDNNSYDLEHNVKEHNKSTSRVKVCVRIRPLIERELYQNCSCCLQADLKNNMITVNCCKNFVFDHVFDTPSTQQQIFDVCAEPLIESYMTGYNATIMAYGQTGSGKTYTMGSSFGAINYNYLTNELVETVGASNDGIIPMVIRSLMIKQAADKRKNPKKEYVITATFVEIYNEEIYDLLSNANDPFNSNCRYKDNAASLREDKFGNILMCGVKEERIETQEELFIQLERGAKKRATSAHLMNSVSSRSHAIFTIQLEQCVKNNAKSENAKEQYICSKFRFVDLAGSERLDKTGAKGNTMREGININRGLLALGNLIAALTAPKKAIAHGKKNFIPYRDSKLTRILSDSLGGNSKTWMIANVSPSNLDSEEGLNTLRYASRAMRISNTPVINKDPQEALINQLRQQVFSLQDQLKKYKRVLSNNSQIDQHKLEKYFEAETALQKSRDSSDGKFRNEAFQKSLSGLKLTNQESSGKKLTFGNIDNKYNVFGSNSKSSDKNLCDIEDWKKICIRKEKEIMTLKDENSKLKNELGETRLSYCKVLEEQIKNKDNTSLNQDNELITVNIAEELESQPENFNLENLIKEKLSQKQNLQQKDNYINELQNELQNLQKISAKENELLYEKSMQYDQLTREQENNYPSYNKNNNKNQQFYFPVNQPNLEKSLKNLKLTESGIATDKKKLIREIEELLESPEKNNQKIKGSQSDSINNSSEENNAIKLIPLDNIPENLHNKESYQNENLVTESNSDMESLQLASNDVSKQKLDDETQNSANNNEEIKFLTSNNVSIDIAHNYDFRNCVDEINAKFNFLKKNDRQFEGVSVNSKTVQADQSIQVNYLEYQAQKDKDEKDLQLVSKLQSEKENELIHEKSKIQDEFANKQVQLEKELVCAERERDKKEIELKQKNNLLNQQVLGGENKNLQKAIASTKAEDNKALIKKIELQKKVMSSLEGELSKIKKSKLEIVKRMRDRAESFMKIQTKNDKLLSKITKELEKKDLEVNKIKQENKRIHVKYRTLIKKIEKENTLTSNYYYNSKTNPSATYNQRFNSKLSKKRFEKKILNKNLEINSKTSPKNSFQLNKVQNDFNKAENELENLNKQQNKPNSVQISEKLESNTLDYRDEGSVVEAVRLFTNRLTEQVRMEYQLKQLETNFLELDEETNRYQSNLLKLGIELDVVRSNDLISKDEIKKQEDQQKYNLNQKNTCKDNFELKQKQINNLSEILKKKARFLNNGVSSITTLLTKSQDNSTSEIVVSAFICELEMKNQEILFKELELKKKNHDARFVKREQNTKSKDMINISTKLKNQQTELNEKNTQISKFENELNNYKNVIKTLTEKISSKNEQTNTYSPLFNENPESQIKKNMPEKNLTSEPNFKCFNHNQKQKELADNNFTKDQIFKLITQLSENDSKVNDLKKKLVNSEMGLENTRQTLETYKQKYNAIKKLISKNKLYNDQDVQSTYTSDNKLKEAIKLQPFNFQNQNKVYKNSYYDIHTNLYKTSNDFPQKNADQNKQSVATINPNNQNKQATNLTNVLTPKKPILNQFNGNLKKNVNQSILSKKLSGNEKNSFNKLKPGNKNYNANSKEIEEEAKNYINLIEISQRKAVTRAKSCENNNEELSDVNDKILIDYGKDIVENDNKKNVKNKTHNDKKSLNNIHNNLDKCTKPLDKYYTKKNLNYVKKDRKNKKFNVDTVFSRHNTITLGKQFNYDDGNFTEARDSYNSKFFEDSNTVEHISNKIKSYINSPRKKNMKIIRTLENSFEKQSSNYKNQVKVDKNTINVSENALDEYNLDKNNKMQFIRNKFEGQKFCNKDNLIESDYIIQFGSDMNSISCLDREENALQTNQSHDSFVDEKIRQNILNNFDLNNNLSSLNKKHSKNFQIDIKQPQSMNEIDNQKRNVNLQNTERRELTKTASDLVKYGSNKEIPTLNNYTNIYKNHMSSDMEDELIEVNTNEQAFMKKHNSELTRENVDNLLVKKSKIESNQNLGAYDGISNTMNLSDLGTPDSIKNMASKFAKANNNSVYYKNLNNLIKNNNEVSPEYIPDAQKLYKNFINCYDKETLEENLAYAAKNQEKKNPIRNSTSKLQQRRELAIRERSIEAQEKIKKTIDKLQQEFSNINPGTKTENFSHRNQPIKLDQSSDKNNNNEVIAQTKMDSEKNTTNNSTKEIYSLAKELVSKKSDLNSVSSKPKLSKKSLSEKNMACANKNWGSDKKSNNHHLKNIQENLEFSEDEPRSQDMSSINCNEKVNKFVQLLRSRTSIHSNEEVVTDINQFDILEKESGENDNNNNIKSKKHMKQFENFFLQEKNKKVEPTEKGKKTFKDNQMPLITVEGFDKYKESNYNMIPTIEFQTQQVSTANYCLDNKVISVQTKGLEIFDFDGSNYRSFYYKKTNFNLAKTIAHSSQTSMGGNNDNPFSFYTAAMSEKYIMKWDMRELKPVQTFKADQSINRQMLIWKNYLIVCGRGTNANINNNNKTGGIFFFDLRNNKLVETINNFPKSQQDITCMTISKKNMLYLGSKNSHHIKQLNMNFTLDDSSNNISLHNLGNLESPHLDIVNNICFMGDFQVSSSKDKIIKLYDTNRNLANYKNKLFSGGNLNNYYYKQINTYKKSEQKYNTSKLVNQINNPHLNEHISQIIAFDSESYNNRNSILSASLEGTVKHWEYVNKKSEDSFVYNRQICKDTIPVTEEKIESLCWADKNNMSFLVGCGDKKIKRFDKEIFTL